MRSLEDFADLLIVIGFTGRMIMLAYENWAGAEWTIYFCLVLLILRCRILERKLGV